MKLRRSLGAALVVAAAVVSCAGEQAADDSTPSPTSPTSPAPSTTATAQAVLEDGRHFGYIKAVDGSSRVLVFDLAEFLTGAAAEQAAQEDGHEASNDYYIRNKKTKLRDAPYGTDVTITLVNWPDCCDNPVAGDLAKFVSSFQPGGADELYKGPDSQYWLVVSDGVVTKIEEQYLP